MFPLFPDDDYWVCCFFTLIWRGVIDAFNKEPILFDLDPKGTFFSDCTGLGGILLVVRRLDSNQLHILEDIIDSDRRGGLKFFPGGYQNRVHVGWG